MSPRFVDPELKAEATRLRAEGHGYTTIEKRTGLSKGTLAYWFSNGVKEKVNARNREYKRQKRREAGALPRDEYERQRREASAVRRATKAKAPRPKKRPTARKPRPKKSRARAAPKPREPQPLSHERQRSVEERVRARLGGL